MNAERLLSLPKLFFYACFSLQINTISEIETVFIYRKISAFYKNKNNIIHVILFCTNTVF